MEEKIAALRAELEADLAAVHNKDELSAFWQKYLSKNGSVTGLTKSLRDVPKEERPAAGQGDIHGFGLVAGGKLGLFDLGRSI